MIPLAAAISAATLVGVGAQHRFGEGAEALARRVMTVILWTAVPAVAFFNIAALEFTARIGAGIAYAYVGLAIALGTAYLLGTYVLRFSRPVVGALLCAIAVGNTGFFGLPFTVAVFGVDELGNAVVFDVLVSLITLVTVAFSVGAAFGTASTGARERIVSFFSRNPPFWAAVAGFIAPAALAPEWAVQGSQYLVLAVVPFGFFAVGVALAAEGRAGDGPNRLVRPIDAPVALAILLKVIVLPAVVLGLSLVLLDVPDSYLTQAAMGTGITTIFIANSYGLDRGVAAGAIVWTNLLVIVAGLVVVVF